MVKMFGEKNLSLSFLRQTDTHFTRGWCTANFIAHNVNETGVILLRRQIDTFEYELYPMVNALSLLQFSEYLLTAGFLFHNRAIIYFSGP